MKRKWVTVKAFCQNHNLSKESVETNKSTGRFPKEIFKKEKGALTLIDENWYIRRKEFALKAKMATHDLYYLLEEHFNSSDIAKEICRQIGKDIDYRSLVVYFKQGMFYGDTDTITDINLSRNRVAMYRYWWKIERRLRRRGTSIEKILDKRAIKYYEDGNYD